jgi:hypothetical protein
VSPEQRARDDGVRRRDAGPSVMERSGVPVSDLRTATVEELRRMVDDALGRERGVDPLNELARRAATSDPAPLDAETLADVLHETICGPFATIDPKECVAGRSRDVRLAEVVIRKLRDTTGREPSAS